MKVRKSVIAATVVLCAAVSAFAQGSRGRVGASPVTAKLVVPDTKLLPGVPFEMWVELNNPSDAAVMVGLCADMIVQPQGTDAFTISLGREEGPEYPTLLPESEWMGPAVRELVLRPRQSQTLTLPLETHLEEPAYFQDSRLSGTGRYTISLRLDYCSSRKLPRKAPPEFLGAVTTNDVTIERIEPTGTDAAVWTRMQQVTNGKWIPTRSWSQVINEVLTKYRDSHYFPYAVAAAAGFGMAPQARYDELKRAVDEFPNSPVVEMLYNYLYTTTIAACEMKGSPRAAVCQRAEARLKTSKRPTTRIRAFGREDVPAPPCSPNEDCVD